MRPTFYVPHAFKPKLPQVHFAKFPAKSVTIHVRVQSSILKEAMVVTFLPFVYLQIDSQRVVSTNLHSDLVWKEVVDLRVSLSAHNYQTCTITSDIWMNLGD